MAPFVSHLPDEWYKHEASPAFPRRWTLEEWKASPTTAYDTNILSVSVAKARNHNVQRYLCAQNVLDGLCYFSPVVHIHSPHMRLSDEFFSIRMLRGNLWTQVIESKNLKFSKSADNHWFYLSCGWLSFIEVIVFWGVWRFESRLEEDTTHSYGFNGSWTLIWETKTYKNLKNKKC